MRVIKSKNMRLMGHLHTGKINAYNILARKPLVNISLGKHKFSWDDNIEIGFK
jgi:hypothetical protein